MFVRVRMLESGSWGPKDQTRLLEAGKYYQVEADEAESIIRLGAGVLDSVPAQVGHEDADDPVLHALRSRLEELERERVEQLAAAAAAKKAAEEKAAAKPMPPPPAPNTSETLKPNKE